MANDGAAIVVKLLKRMNMNIICSLKNKNLTHKNYICCEYEAEQDTGFHKPNLIVAHYFEGTKVCFTNNEEFYEMLISAKPKAYIAIAHNNKLITRSSS